MYSAASVNVVVGCTYRIRSSRASATVRWNARSSLIANSSRRPPHGQRAPRRGGGAGPKVPGGNVPRALTGDAETVLHRPMSRLTRLDREAIGNGTVAFALVALVI